MLNQTDPAQLKFEAFKTPFEMKMDKENRWVKLSEIIPWKELINIYAKTMSDFGRPSIEARKVIGSVIIKTKLALSDEETIEQIKENPYMQYFLGYEQYSKEPVFDPSLFVHIRERLGQEVISQMNLVVVSKAITGREKQNNNKPKDLPISAEGNEQEKKEDTQFAKEQVSNPNDQTSQEKAVMHKGSLLLDATVSDQNIKYPTDVELLQDSRQKSEGIIDLLYESSQMKKKPRTYRRKARRDFLIFTKKKKTTIKQIRKGIKQQLQYLGRNLKNIEKMLEASGNQGLTELKGREYKNYMVIQEIYRQQKGMYEQKIHRCEDRIVSIGQPYVRPIVRGKKGKDVEFGSKALVGLIGGSYSIITKLDWNGYNEGGYVLAATEQYKKTLGYYPEVVIGDQIFITRSNRANLEELGIRLSGKRLGRKTAEQKEQDKKRMIKEQSERVRIEGKFGQGKNKYNLNKIRMRKALTSESMVATIFFVMNLIAYAKEVLLCPLFKIVAIVEKVISRLLCRLSLRRVVVDKKLLLFQ